MKRIHVPFDNSWGMQIEIPVSRAVRCGDLIFTCGQCDLDSGGNPLRPGDLSAQTERVMEHVFGVLGQAGVDPGDLIRLHVFYVSDGRVNEDEYRALLAHLVHGTPGPVITLTPIPFFYYPGMMVEIDAIAMLGENGTRLRRSNSSPNTLPPLEKEFSHGMRCGEMIFIGAQAPLDQSGRVLHPENIQKQTEIVMENIAITLDGFNATLDDVVMMNNYYRNSSAAAGWQDHTGALARYFRDPGPAVTFIPLPSLWPEGVSLRIEVIAMLGEDGAHLPHQHVRPDDHWDWPLPMPYAQGIRCRDKIFIGGQIPLNPSGEITDPGDMAAQTHAAMAYMREVLSGFNAGLEDLVKVNVWYRGGPNPDDLHTNLNIRSSYFKKPAAASTGVPVPHLIWPGMTISIDAIAMKS